MLENLAAPPLAPRRVVEVIDRAFRIYRDNFITLIGLVAVIIVPLTLINQAIQITWPDDPVDEQDSYYYDYDRYFNELYRAAALWLAVNGLGFFLRTILINGLVTYISSESHLGSRATIIEAFRQAGGRLGVLALGLLVAGMLFIVATAIAGFLTTFLIGLLLLPVVLYLGLATYFFIVPVLILENTGIGTGIRRALMLGKARFWRPFRFVLGILVINLVMITAFSVFIELVFETGDTASDVLAVLAGMLVDIFLAPILPIGLTLMYYDPHHPPLVLLRAPEHQRITEVHTVLSGEALLYRQFVLPPLGKAPRHQARDRFEFDRGEVFAVGDDRSLLKPLVPRRTPVHWVDRLAFHLRHAGYCFETVDEKLVVVPRELVPQRHYIHMCHCDGILVEVLVELGDEQVAHANQRCYAKHADQDAQDNQCRPPLTRGDITHNFFWCVFEP